MKYILLISILFINILHAEDNLSKDREEHNIKQEIKQFKKEKRGEVKQFKKEKRSQLKEKRKQKRENNKARRNELRQKRDALRQERSY